MRILQMLTLNSKNHPKCGLLDLISGFNRQLFFQSKARLVGRGNILSSGLQSSWLQDTGMPLF